MKNRLRGDCKTCFAKLRKLYNPVRNENRKQHPNYERKVKEYNLRKYRLTLEEFNAMIFQQSGLCKCCGDLTDLVVDHNHSNGKVRGLLCHNCNTAIGLLKEDPSRAIAVISYLSNVA